MIAADEGSAASSFPKFACWHRSGDVMKYRIALHRSDEGYSVSVPGLPGCWSQGATEPEALDNIRDAIRDYLAVVEQQLEGEDIREIEVAL
jgi:predicted RNase H-like HicB family nuclease